MSAPAVAPAYADHQYYNHSFSHPYQNPYWQQPTSSDFALASTLQDQELAWHRQLAAPAEPSDRCDPYSHGQRIYNRISDSGSTRQFAPQSWSSYADSSEAARSRLQQRLAQYGLKEVAVQGDGNCQFRALADQLYGDERCHGRVRQAVAWQLARHPDLYMPHLDQAYGPYCRRMAVGGEWGDHVTLQAAADVFGCRIVVLTSFAGDAPFLELVPRQQQQQQRGESSEGRVLCISYRAEAHYNSVYPHHYQHPSQKKVLGSKKLHKLVRVLF